MRVGMLTNVRHYDYVKDNMIQKNFKTFVRVLNLKNLLNSAVELMNF